MLEFEWVCMSERSQNDSASVWGLVLRWQNFLSIPTSKKIVEITRVVVDGVSRCDLKITAPTCTMRGPWPDVLWSVRSTPRKMRTQFELEARMYNLDNFGFPRDIGPYVKASIFDEIEIMIARMCILG